MDWGIRLRVFANLSVCTRFNRRIPNYYYQLTSPSVTPELLQLLQLLSAPESHRTENRANVPASKKYRRTLYLHRPKAQIRLVSTGRDWDRQRFVDRERSFDRLEHPEPAGDRSVQRLQPFRHQGRAGWQAAR